MLCRPAFKTDCRAGIAGPIPKGRQPAAGVIHQIFQIIQCTATGLKTPQQRLSTILSLERMAEHNMAVAQGCAVFGKFFKAKDHRVIRGVWPSVFRRDAASDSVVSFKVNRALGAFFDGDLKARLSQGFCPVRGQPDPCFVWPLFGPYPEMCHNVLILFAETSLAGIAPFLKIGFCISAVGMIEMRHSVELGQCQVGSQWLP